MIITKEEFVRRQKALLELNTNYVTHLNEGSSIDVIVRLSDEIKSETEFLSQVFVEN